MPLSYTRKRGLLRRGIIFCAMLWAALLLVGCTPQYSYKGTRLSLPIDADIKTFNPVLVSDAYSQAVLGLVFSGLLTPDREGNMMPDLAQSWEFRNNGLELVFTLREGLKWSDGMPLTIEDVLFSFKDIYFNPQIPSSSQDIFRIGMQRQLPRLEKIADRSVVFKLPEPFAPFLRFAGGASILPKHILAQPLQTTDSQGKSKFIETWAIDTPVDQIVGSGPYRLRQYIPGERVVYDRNPYFWQVPLPRIPQVVYQIMGSPDSVVLRFRAQELDAIPAVRGQDFQILKRFTQRNNFTIYPLGESSNRSFMLFNLNQGRGEGGIPFVEPHKSRWFNDLNFRRAIAYSLDREAMINAYFRGLGEPQDSPIPSISPYYFPRSAGVPFYDFNPEKAKELLKESGFTYNAQNQLLDPAGNPVRFSLITSAGGAGASLGPMIRNDLDRVGIVVDFQVLEFTALIDKLDRSKQWDVAMLGFGGGIEPHGSFHLWHSAGASHLFNQGPEPGKPAYAGRKVSDWEKQIDRLLIAGAREIDEAKRRSIYGEFQKVVQQNVPLIYLVTPLSMTAIYDRVQGVDPSPASGPFWNLEHLSLSAQPQKG